jgi:hypothetical protein
MHPAMLTFVVLDLAALSSDPVGNLAFEQIVA